MSSSKKLTCKGTLRQCLSVLGPLPSQVCVQDGLAILQALNLVRYRVLTPAEYGLQQVSTPPTTSHHTLYLYIVQYFDTGRGKGRGVEPERRLEWQQFTNIYIVHRPAVEYCSTSYVEYCPPPSLRGMLSISRVQIFVHLLMWNTVNFLMWNIVQLPMWNIVPFLMQKKMFSSLSRILFTS